MWQSCCAGGSEGANQQASLGVSEALAHRQMTKSSDRTTTASTHTTVELCFVPQRSLGATLDMCRHQGQVINRLSATRARTLVIGGLADPILPPGVLREAVVAPIPDARLVALDCGHEIPLEQPQATATLLEALLAGLGPSA
jgi:pimeloyl-ACP methyl ester carboxylesterase